MFLQWLVSWLAPGTADLYNDWRFVWLNEWPLGVWWAAAGLLALAVLGSTWGAQRLPSRVRYPVLVLRLASAGLLFILFLQPGVELRAVSPIRGQVLVVYDGSRSMGLGDRDQTRAEAVVAHRTDNDRVFRDLSARATLESYVFGRGMQPIAEQPNPLPADQGRTQLGRLLKELQWQAAGRDVGAVILYSDGADSEGLTREEAERLAQQVEAPIHTIGFSRRDSAKDLAIRRVRVDDFAFVHNTVTMDVEVEARGLRFSQVPVTLRRDGAVLQTQDVELEDGVGRVTFEFKPRQVGREVYGVSTPVQVGEAIEANNQKDVVLRVIRDRIRILQVAGRPSWDVRFLRELLKRNPNVDLISFFILRSVTDVHKASQDELALIPFPVNDLFTTELPSFDVVIYQNFSYRPYRMAHYLRNIRRYVLDGGSFLMIGGDQSFEPGFYAGTPIAEILPVRLGGGLAWDPAPFTPRLTGEGRRHPVTRIGEPGVAPSSTFERLPQLEGFNGSTGLMPGAQALLAHPTLPGNPPVVSIREVGDGRSMAVATDSLWFWRYEAVGQGTSGREYERFWQQSLRWLIRDPELSRVRADLRRSVVYRDEPVSAEIRVLGLDYSGIEGAEVEASLVPLDAEVEGRGEAVTTGPDGLAVLSFDGLAPGSYLLEIRAYDGGESVGTAREPVIVQASDVEMQSPFPRPDLMKAIAEASGGTYTDVREPLKPIALEDPRRVEVDRTLTLSIWDGPVPLLLLLGLLTAEWWLRRRGGLL